MIDVAYALLVEDADWTDRVAVISGIGELPFARRSIDELLADTVADVDAEEDAETNVVELASFVDRVNGGMR